MCEKLNVLDEGQLWHGSDRVPRLDDVEACLSSGRVPIMKRAHFKSVTTKPANRATLNWGLESLTCTLNSGAV